MSACRVTENTPEIYDYITAPVIIDAKALNVAPVIDPVAAVVLSADVSNVDTVMVAGVVKKRHGRLLADLDKARGDVEASRDHLLRATAVPQPA